MGKTNKKYKGGSDISRSPKPPRTKKRKRGAYKSRSENIVSPKSAQLKKCIKDLQKCIKENKFHIKNKDQVNRMLDALKLDVAATIDSANDKIERLLYEKKTLICEKEELKKLLSISKRVADHATNNSMRASEKCNKIEGAYKKLQQMIDNIKYGKPVSPNYPPPSE